MFAVDFLYFLEYPSAIKNICISVMYANVLYNMVWSEIKRLAYFQEIKVNIVLQGVLLSLLNPLL